MLGNAANNNQSSEVKVVVVAEGEHSEEAKGREVAPALDGSEIIFNAELKSLGAGPVLNWLY